LNINNIPLEFIFIPETPQEGESEGFSGNYAINDPEGLDFRKLCCDLVWYHFIEAWTCMKPLFEDFVPESISFCIDLTPDPGGVASVRINQARPLRSSETRIHISVKRILLEEYLSNYWLNAHETPYFAYTALQHELIHVLDRFQEEQFILAEGRSLGRSLILYLLRFRSEGIAELPCTLLHGSSVSDIETARKMFGDELYRVFEICRKHPRDYLMMSSNLPATYAFYELGPWMAMHVLGCQGNPSRSDLVLQVLENLKTVEKNSDEMILRLISEALEITNYSFMKYLEEPGPDGLPFINSWEMGVIVNMTGQTSLTRRSGDSFKHMDSRIADYYAGKMIKLYNKWGRMNKSGEKMGTVKKQNKTA